MNNSEKFAIYCKTGVALAAAGYGTPVLVEGPSCIYTEFLTSCLVYAPLHLNKDNGLWIAATLFGYYSSLRSILDIRRNRGRDGSFGWRIWLVTREISGGYWQKY